MCSTIQFALWHRLFQWALARAHNFITVLAVDTRTRAFARTSCRDKRDEFIRHQTTTTKMCVKTIRNLYSGRSGLVIMSKQKAESKPNERRTNIFIASLIEAKHIFTSKHKHKTAIVCDSNLLFISGFFRCCCCAIRFWLLRNNRIK